ncbi:UNVERIFIED_ORG: hypothetical protein QOE_2528 [Clostridioides difficile F501]
MEHVHSLVWLCQREAPRCPESPRFAAERAFAREGKRKRGEAGCIGASQRRALPAAVKPTE